MNKLYRFLFGALGVILLGSGIIALTANSNSTTNTTTSAQNISTTTKQTTATTSTSYTLADVSQHSSSSDCWMVIEGNVYDVSSYISQHPGRDSILQGCGIDATDLFTGKSRLGKLHSSAARALLKNLLIGTLQTS